ncbi:MAG: phenylalanine--tRNA ligase subunit beta [Planctomycetota bacterium]
MNISRKWLNRHVDLDDKSAQEILLDLTMSTAEVEGVVAFGKDIQDVVVGQVLKREKHPDADKLSVCQVAVSGEEPQQIVCGAPNVRDGLKVAVIRPGSRLPDGTKIKKSKIRGAESLGMICSESELGLSDSHDGILELDESLSVGTSVVDALDLRDDIWEVDNKSINHRPDLWGHRGIARELAAVYERPLKPLDLFSGFPEAGETRPVVIDDLEACPRYIGLVLQGVEVKPSPQWLQRLLGAVGQRAIDLCVDLTNFVQLDLGQPMHAFDLGEIDAKGIGVRFARKGETMITLDEIERKLSTEDLLITSGDRPVALAGIMGGMNSMVRGATTSLFLESASFKASTIRRTSTRLGLRTDSSARFEKAQDPGNAETAVRHFVSLLREECPSVVAAGPMVDPSGWSFPGRKVPLRRDRLDRILGTEVSSDRVRGYFEALEFGVEENADGFVLDVPSFRATKDIAIEEDLIEEVGRMIRYDNIPERPLVQAISVPPKELELTVARTAVQLCAHELGAHEVYNYSFVPDALVDAVGAADQPYVRVTNPVAPEITRMRRHVLPSVLAAVAPNLRQEVEVRMFEDGRGVLSEHRDEHGLPAELRELAIVFARRDDAAGPSPYAQLRTGVEQLGRRLGYPLELHSLLASPEPWCHPGKTVGCHRGEEVVGYVGHLHPRVARALELPLSTAIASLELRALLRTEPAAAKYARLSEFPTQAVDVALLVPRAIQVQTIATFLRDAGRKLVQDVRLFEVYTGDGLDDGQKSLNFTVTLGSHDRTLTAKDEEKYLSTVRRRCEEVGATLRG